MIFGAIGMIVYCILAAFALERFSAVAGSAVPFAAWFAVAGLSYLFVLR
jgi:hypothetical protein